MTKEQIEKATDEYIGYAKEVDEGLSTTMRRSAFMDGAQWRIDSVWHDAEEEPKRNAWFLAQIGDGAFDTFIMQIDSSRWDRWCNVLNIKRWAYIDDLLPDRKEESI